MPGVGSGAVGQNGVGNFGDAVLLSADVGAGVTVTRAELTTGTRLQANAQAGASAGATLGVTRRLAADTSSGAQTTSATLGVERQLRVVPGTQATDTGGVGFGGVGGGAVGEFATTETTGQAGARAQATLGVERQAAADVSAGTTADATLGVTRRLTADAAGGASADATIGVVRQFTVAAGAGATATATLYRGVLPDHLFVSLGEADAATIALGDADGVSVALALRRRGENPQP